MSALVIGDTRVSNLRLETPEIDVEADINAGGFICDSVGCIGMSQGVNIFNQSLNTTDNVTFNDLNLTGDFCDEIECLPFFNPRFEQFNSLPESNTSLMNQQSKLSVTTNQKRPGLYRVGFNAEVSHSLPQQSVFVEFIIDGTPIHDHVNGTDILTVTLPQGGTWIPLHSVSYVNITSSKTIDLNITWGRLNGNARISNAIIEIWRVS